MKATRRSFLQTAAAAPLAAAGGNAPLDSAAIARTHNLVAELPTPNFFEGMLMGNGDIGVCVVCRPDALGLHLGKLDVWDIRVSEEHVEHLLTFKQILQLWEEASARAKRDGRPDATFLERSDPEMSEYVQKMRSSYAKRWPRPWPCGTVWLHWDARKVTIERQELDLASGIYRLDVTVDDLAGGRRRAYLECCVNWTTGHIVIDGDAPVSSVAYYPHVEDEARMPAPELATGDGAIRCTQRLPATAPTDEVPEPGESPDDRIFALAGLLDGGWTADETPANQPRALFRKQNTSGPVRVDLTLFTSLDDPTPEQRATAEAQRWSARPAAAAKDATRVEWRKFWSRSAVALEDKDLERIWYRNQYFLACTLRVGKVAPGLFGNWSTGQIGTAWHGDYHMNYNTQQVWWGVFSSNHIDQHLPYVDLVEKLMPMAEWNARVQFDLPGAYFPHSAYPVPSNVNPYPVPPWGYEICETPWTVQSLWWHYQYTLDDDFLRRVYPLLRAATDFLMAFAKKEADGKYHLNPSVSPENWGMTVDYRLNRDISIDIALTEFLLDAMIEASKVLGRDTNERGGWAELRDNLPDYPVVDGPYGRVWIDVADSPAEHVYNVPVTTSHVFPAEQVGERRRTDQLEIARRTVRTVRLEGGNDLVWQPLVRARLGMLDLDWFKREVRYSLLPGGFANDRVRQIGGRYRDTTNSDFMMRMGVWTENLSLPAVLNECMLQSHEGMIRLFPNTQNLGPARFENLRARGAFLVSAAWDGKQVQRVRVLSEKGALARIELPWPAAAVSRGGRAVDVRRSGQVVEFETAAQQVYTIDALGS
jgi:alpha-L-fucosidase 2